MKTQLLYTVQDEMSQTCSTHREMSNADQVVDGTMTLRLIIRKYGVTIWTGFIWLRIWISGSCEHGNDSSVFIKGGEFVD
jgi:hypothetical protein